IIVHVSLPDALPISALSLVSVDKPYEQLAQSLLGHVYITEATTATELPDIAEDWVIINTQGSILKGKYHLSGGSIGKFEGNKIGRAKNLERLAKEIKALTKKAEELKQQIDTQK